MENETVDLKKQEAYNQIREAHQKKMEKNNGWCECSACDALLEMALGN